MGQNSNKIKVMLVDDSAVVRGFLSKILESADDAEVVGSAINGEQAVEMVNRIDPDIVILDIEMPVMDGITALPKILEVRPQAKILMCSTLSTKNADISMQALALGAVDCIGKPTTAINIKNDTEFRDSFLYKIRNIARPGHAAPANDKASGGSFLVKPKINQSARTRPNFKPKSTEATNESQKSVSNSASSGQEKARSLTASTTLSTPTTASNNTEITGALKLVSKTVLNNTAPKLLAIGSSTGGPQALFKFLGDLKKPNVPIVITQHMPATFTKILANHIEQHTGLASCEGEDGMVLEAGKVYVAPGGKHMLFEKKGSSTCVKIDDGPPENFCKPAVDPMLRSLVSIYGSSFLTVILTGMGADGLEGGKLFVEKGGRLIAQDEASSVVWGMPGAVANAGICMQVLPLDDMGQYVSRILF